MTGPQLLDNKGDKNLKIIRNSWHFPTGQRDLISHVVKVKVKSLSCVRLFVTPWAIAYQAPPSIGFSRQEYWSGLPFPSPGDLPDSGIEPRSPALQADALTSEPPVKPSHVVKVIVNSKKLYLQLSTHLRDLIRKK